MQKAVVYYRVSTKKQGYSGLGLAAQRNSVRQFATTHKIKIINEHKEIESTRRIRRPKLEEALEECKCTNAILLIAKLNRLHRKVLFISMLLEAGVKFKAVDIPNANKLELYIRAAFDEDERDQTSIRTKEALAAARQKGVKLGTYGKIQAKKNKAKANRFARKMKPIIKKLNKQGFTSVRDIADRLNKKRVKTFLGRKAKWHSTTVFNLIKRIGALL